VFEEQVAAQLRRRVAADAQARATLAALDATVADLGALPQQRSAPVPDAVADRLEAALAAEALLAGYPGEPTQAVSPLAARRRRKAGWAGLTVLGAAAAATGVLALSGLQVETPGTPRAADALGSATVGRPAEPLALTRANLGDAMDQALTTRDYGPLSSPALLQNCLAANGMSPSGEPLGAREVTLDGQPGVLLVLPTGRIGQVRLLVVGPNCSLDTPSRMGEYVVGR
jgi:hypothetical protein